MFHTSHVEVVLPRRPIAWRIVEDFLREQGAHICRRWQRIQQPSFWPAPLVPGVALPYAGESRVLCGPALSADAPEDRVVRVNDVTHPWPEIQAWYMREAERMTLQAVAHYAPQVGRYPTGVRIRAMKGAWGTCTTTDRIHINWLLMAAPLDVLHYVVVHELCHLFFKDHSVRFWDCVSRVLPAYRAQVLWLRRYGIRLRPPVSI